MQNKKQKAPSPELYQELRTQDTATLTEDLEGIIENGGDVLSDDVVNRLIATLDVLEEKAPVLPEDYNVENELRSFEKRNAQFFKQLDAKKPKEAPKHKRFTVHRILLVAAVTAALLVIAAQAAGFNLFQMVIDWRDEVFMLAAPNSGVMELAEAPSGEYASLAAALEAYHISDDVDPTWIPSDLEIQYARAKDLGGSRLIVAYYESAERTLSIKVTYYDQVGTAIFEHSAQDGNEYYIDNQLFSISTNNDQCRATWTTPHCAVTANGNITENEMGDVLSSIFKE